MQSDTLRRIGRKRRSTAVCAIYSSDYFFLCFQVVVAREPGAAVQHRGQSELGMGTDAVFLVSGMYKQERT